MQRTLAIIKPDAIRNGYQGKIIDHILDKGLRIVAMEQTHLTTAEAREFYAVHKERPFYNDLVEFMTSGPCIPMVLEHEHAVSYFREVIGATNPEEANEGTVRKLYAESLQNNAVHGSDSPENAQKEIAFFFTGRDIIT
ncbi:MAG: nucleoside-diphosphate kinase [Candidatus Marinimicrobia bacterium]|nr:nucleoside-diphosphate kinase [Candidatus Neomarinimicrobiota bacterium]MCF7830109.1 nucleoside-diphosphate kinase [Candidatus Neomarinimicrobiota bacterium]MCF7882156.1 nucleoside-diphosphate kinase [Candidatus Neomarinimicrobiota bacterium]